MTVSAAWPRAKRQRVDIDGDSQQTFWYHTDLNGLPERLTDEEGDVVWRGQFSSWGETEYESGGSRLAVPQNLRFQGQYLDRETGLHYNLFRYYDPVMGRFTQPDPIGLVGGINLYQYGPSPLSWIDPLGLSGDNVFIHYTDKAGFENIMKAGILNANNKGKVYITDLLMPPQDVMRDVLINNPNMQGEVIMQLFLKLTLFRKQTSVCLQG